MLDPETRLDVLEHQMRELEDRTLLAVELITKCLYALRDKSVTLSDLELLLLGEVNDG